MHGSTRLAHCVTQSGEIQENSQEHHDQHDGHPGGGHKEAGGTIQQTLGIGNGKQTSRLLNFGTGAHLVMNMLFQLCLLWWLNMLSVPPLCQSLAGVVSTAVDCQSFYRFVIYFAHVNIVFSKVTAEIVKTDIVLTEQ